MVVRNIPNTPKVINETGAITSICPDCHSNGSLSTFNWRFDGHTLHGFEQTQKYHTPGSSAIFIKIRYQLFRCMGCGRGAFGVIKYNGKNYPGTDQQILDFHPSPISHFLLQEKLDEGIGNEFREAEICIANGCFRAAAALLRSVLEKTLTINGYTDDVAFRLPKKIELACKHGLITSALALQAHDEIIVQGNNVVHRDWFKISRDQIESSRHYCYKIMDAFYDNRPEVERILKEKKSELEELKSKNKKQENPNL